MIGYETPKSIKILKEIIKESTMPTNLKKRHVFYCEDKIWNKLVEEAEQDKVSVSKVIRNKLSLCLN